MQFYILAFQSVYYMGLYSNNFKYCEICYKYCTPYMFICMVKPAPPQQNTGVKMKLRSLLLAEQQNEVREQGQRNNARARDWGGSMTPASRQGTTCMKTQTSTGETKANYNKDNKETREDSSL